MLLPIQYCWFQPGWCAHHFRRKTCLPDETQRVLKRVLLFYNRLVDRL